MTQQHKRDATADLDYLKNSHKQDVLEVTVQAIAMADYWIKEAESQQKRAEAAEQERDRLKERINLAIGVLNMMQSGRFDKQTVIEMLERIIREGSKPDAPE